MVEFRFEYDHVKSRADKAKHGMDFAGALARRVRDQHAEPQAE